MISALLAKVGYSQYITTRGSSNIRAKVLQNGLVDKIATLWHFNLCSFLFCLYSLLILNHFLSQRVTVMYNLRMPKNQDDTIISLNLHAAMKYIKRNQLIRCLLVSTVGLVISGCVTKTKSVENLLNQPATEISVFHQSKKYEKAGLTVGALPVC
jgi:hypothetical protein